MISKKKHKRNYRRAEGRQRRKCYGSLRQELQLWYTVLAHRHEAAAEESYTPAKLQTPHAPTTSISHLSVRQMETAFVLHIISGVTGPMHAIISYFICFVTARTSSNWCRGRHSIAQIAGMASLMHRASPQGNAMWELALNPLRDAPTAVRKLGHCNKIHNTNLHTTRKLKLRDLHSRLRISLCTKIEAKHNLLASRLSLLASVSQSRTSNLFPYVNARHVAFCVTLPFLIRRRHFPTHIL